jgi:gamma-glutamyltranspeptidase/glutathione hydrolase
VNLIRFIIGCLLLLLASGAARAASPPAVESDRFMVVSANRLASEAGAAVLRAGGNAVDAAVAVGYALAVVDPCCGNIGGGGFMTLHLADGRDVFLNFRETAPAAATADMFLDAQGQIVPGSSLFGWRAVGVPGTVQGLQTALAEHGSLPRAQVMAPAIRLARDGFVLTAAESEWIARAGALLSGDRAAAAAFLRPDGTPLQPGDRLRQPALADTLEAIAEGGADAFYRGRIPAAIEAASRRAGGVISAADFAAYRVTESEPLRCDYRGWQVLSAPPPSSGGVTLCELFAILQGYDLSKLGLRSAASVHVQVEAMRHAFLDRNSDLGDPAFVQNPIERLLSKDYAAAIRAQIGPRATPSAALQPGIPPHERAETTHYSVVDGAGNAVAVTYSLNGGFGAGVVAPGAGFLLNDVMDDFTLRPGTPNMFGLVQGAANAIAPGKRPLSSMAPTIVLHDGRLALVLGSPGGPRIITTVLEVALNIIDDGLAPQEAVDAPRLHMQWLPDQIAAEPRALSPDTEALLRGMGYSISPEPPWGAAELIMVGPPRPSAGVASVGNDSGASLPMSPGLLYGASDPRRPQGAAIGK